MFKITEFDANGCEVSSASFSALTDCSAYEDAVVYPRAKQYIITNMDTGVVMHTEDRGARTERHSVDRMFS